MCFYNLNLVKKVILACYYYIVSNTKIQVTCLSLCCDKYCDKDKNLDCYIFQFNKPNL